MLNPHYVENAPQDGFSVLEILSQPDSEGRLRRQFVPLRDTRLVGEIIGPLASLKLQQTFRFTRQECERTIEAAYRFPLPGDAAVLGVRIAFGEVEIEAQLRERQQAEAEYQEAKSQGKQAALLTRESPDVFTLQVAGIAPDEPVIIETRYVQLVRPREQGFELRIPLTTAPRYTRTDEAGSRHAAGQPLAVLRDPGHRFEMFLQIHGATKITSPTHSLNVQETAAGGTPETRTRPATQQVMLQEGKIVPDRDCVIRWQTTAEGDRPDLQAWSGRDGDDEYFLALLSPPQLAAQPKIARELIVLIDHSGSMEGAKWLAADRSVEHFLRGLASSDYFALGIFHSTTKWFHKKLVAASPVAIAKAVDFINESKDSGGTELGVALEQALHFRPALRKAARHVLIVTDGEVTDSSRILQLVEQQPFPQARRISVLCIDTAPNSYLVQEITERSGGIARFLGNPQRALAFANGNNLEIPEGGGTTDDRPENQLTESINEIMRDWDAPLHLGVQIEVNRVQVSSNRQLSQLVAHDRKNTIDAGDLPARRPLWVVGRTNAQDEVLKLRAMSEKQATLATATAATVAADMVPALKALFGTKPVLELEYLMQGHHRPEDVLERLERLGLAHHAANGQSRIYAENRSAIARDFLRGLLVQEALRYGLVCAETAFIAVRHDANRPVEEKVTVANALPNQWNTRFANATANGVTVSAPIAPSADFMAMPSTGMPDAPPAAGSTRGGLSFGTPLFSRRRARQQAAPPTPPNDAEQEVFTLDDLQGEGGITIFTGIPSFASGHALLFDSSKLSSADILMALHRLPQATRLRIRFSGRVEALPTDLILKIRLDGIAQPVMSLSLTDLVRQNATQSGPLDNLLTQPNEFLASLNLPLGSLQSLHVELVSSGGVWKKELGNLTVIVE